MKKIFFGFLFMFLLQTNLLFAYQPPKELKLNVQFDNTASYENIYKQALHINKLIKIDPNQRANNIVGTDSKILKNFPVTMVLLVKSVEITNGQVSLEFNLMEYGYMRSATLLMQPRIILKNGQAGELNTELFKLKVSANWVEQA